MPTTIVNCVASMARSYIIESVSSLPHTVNPVFMGSPQRRILLPYGLFFAIFPLDH